MVVSDFEDSVKKEPEEQSPKSSEHETSADIAELQISPNGYSDLDRIVNYLKCLFTAINE